MSFDAVTWAKAQVCPTPRAKAVLICLAAYADAEGVAWAAVNVLLLETSLGHERTVYRGLADLKACGLIEETGDKKNYKGKLYPVFRLPLERGPQNTRARIAAALAEAPLTPVSGEGSTPDAGVSPTHDTGDNLPLTPVSAKQEDNPHYVREDNPNVGAREAAARLSDLERIAPRSMLRFYDQPSALAGLMGLIADGIDPDLLTAAMGRMSKHPDFRTRKHPPQLHEWLRRRGFIGWETDEGPGPKQPGLPGVAAPELHEHAAGEADRALWQIVDRRLQAVRTDAEYGSWLARAFLGQGPAGALFVVAWSGPAREWIKARCWRQIEGFWKDADKRGRPLTLVSKIEFEALFARQTQEVR